MFGHLFHYGLKTLLRTKELVFWTFLFPIALSTFMYFAFGKIFDTTEKLSVIPVAVVEDDESVYKYMIDAVSEPGEDALLKVTKADREEAENLLREEEVDGILYFGEEPSLKVRGSGMNESILQMILTQFIQYRQVMEDAVGRGPSGTAAAARQLYRQVDCFVEKQETEGNQDNVINYFYAIFAMTCIFAAYSGSEKIQKLQADTSALGQRRSVASVPKMRGILAEFAACELVQYILAVIVFVYLKYILRLDLGEKTAAILLLLLMGTSFGIMFGILIGSLPGIGEGMKTGLVTGISLGLCTLSDLMVSGIKDAVEHSIPIVNDINPAVLISDSFYALNIYDNYDRFLENMVKLGGITVVLALVCYFIVRRNRYASL